MVVRLLPVGHASCFILPSFHGKSCLRPFAHTNIVAGSTWQSLPKHWPQYDIFGRVTPLSHSFLASSTGVFQGPQTYAQWSVSPGGNAMFDITFPSYYSKPRMCLFAHTNIFAGPTWQPFPKHFPQHGIFGRVIPISHSLILASGTSVYQGRLNLCTMVLVSRA